MTMKRVLLCLCAASLTARPAVGLELRPEPRWKAVGRGGFSAPNLLCPAPESTSWRIVVAESDVGVVAYDLAGTRLWEYPLGAPVTATPAVADVDGDGREDVMAADGQGQVVLLDAGGRLIWSAGTPGGVLADSCPAVADLGLEKPPHILVGDTSGALSCFDREGALLWRFQGEGSQIGPLLVADLYTTPGREIIVTSHDQHIYAISARGEWIWDLYRENDLFPNSTPLLADVEGDRVPELFIGGGLHHFYRIDPFQPRIAGEENVHLHVNAAIAAADLDGDGKDEVVFGNKGGQLWCYGAGGLRWTRTFPRSGFYAAPILADLDGAPGLEILMCSNRGDLQLLDRDGTLLAEHTIACRPTASPLVADVDANGALEMIVTSPGGSAGDGVMLCLSLGLPARGDPRQPSTFNANRARTGRAGEPGAPLRPAPSAQPALPAQIAASPDGQLRLLSGVNRWRFQIANPREERAALLLDAICPDGVAHRAVRHTRHRADRLGFAFSPESAGTYTVRVTLAAGQPPARAECLRQQLSFEGSASDARYLETEVFPRIEQAIGRWSARDPAAASHFARELGSSRGTLEHLRRAEGERPAARELADLRSAAERLLALAAAGSAHAGARSLLPWQANPWAYFHPLHSLPPVAQPLERLHASLCVGEYETLAVNLTNLAAETREVRARCEHADGGLGPGGAAAAAAIELRRAVMVPTLRREAVADALPLLDSAGLLTIAPLETAQLWITLCGRNLAPGRHQWSLRLKSLEPDPAEISIPIDVTVHDLALPRPRPLRFCLWQYDGGTLGTDRPEVLSDLVEHGVTVFFGIAPRAKCGPDGALLGEPDFAAHDENLRRLSPHGVLLFGSPQNALEGQAFLSEPWRKAFVSYIKAWTAHMRALDMSYDRWALYPYDEPSAPHAQTTLDLVEVARLIREADPQVRIYTDPTSGTTTESLDMLSGLIDIWCPSAELLERMGDELPATARGAGKEVWFYDAAGRAKTLSCLGIYRWRFWYAWNRQLTGVGWWCHSHHGGADLWDGPNATGDYFATVYDGLNGAVVSSKRWEAAREGLEDYEYLTLLTQSLGAAEARGADPAAIAAATRLLAELPPRIESVLQETGRRLPLTTDSAPVYDAAAAALEDARRQIVEACLALQPPAASPRR